jgi:hypothetical protein
MMDFGNILLTQILRATVQVVQESPAIDAAHPGIVDFQRVLNEEMVRLSSAGLRHRYYDLRASAG